MCDICHIHLHRSLGTMAVSIPEEAADMDQSLLFRKLNDVAATIELPEGSILFQAGDRAEGLYLIRSGRVALRWGTDPHVFLRETVGSGEIVGLAAALNGTHDATAKLTEDGNLGFVSLPA